MTACFHEQGKNFLRMPVHLTVPLLCLWLIAEWHCFAIPRFFTYFVGWWILKKKKNYQTHNLTPVLIFFFLWIFTYQPKFHQFYEVHRCYESVHLWKTWVFGCCWVEGMLTLPCPDCRPGVWARKPGCPPLLRSSPQLLFAIQSYLISGCWFSRILISLAQVLTWLSSLLGLL